MRNLAIAVLLVVAFGALVGQCILMVRLREHRTDLQPRDHFGQGGSPFWQANVLRPGNYTPASQRLLRWVSGLQVLWLLCIALGGGFFMGLM